MNIRKLSGWLLLIIGLSIIFFALYSSYNIFITKKAVPEIFQFSKEETVLENNQEVQGSQKIEEALDIEEDIKKNIEEQMESIFPAEVISKFFNLIAWAIFVGILIFGGTQISGLGIRLIKE